MRRISATFFFAFGLLAACSGADDPSIPADPIPLADSGADALVADRSTSPPDATPPPDDASVVDAAKPHDAGYDAGHDAGQDAGQDAGHDAGQDAGHDAGQDAGFDAGQDAGVDAGPDGGKAAACTGSFGTALTGVYGRLDGTVLAVVPPADPACPLPNSDHVTLDVVMGGAAYRVLVNVSSTVAQADPRVQLLETSMPLVGGAWTDGWHTSVSLDYVSTLGVSSASFTPYSIDELASRIDAAIPLGAKISVYGTGFSPVGNGEHLIHRNLTGADGAIVIGPDTASPHWMLFHFGNQSF